MSTTDKIIEVKVSGSYLTRDSQTAGVQGEANAAALRIEFDPGWDGLAKTITWWNARGENEVKRLLTADLLEDLTESSRSYLTAIPGEALTVAGKCRFAIDGYVAGRRQRSVYSELVVKPAGGGQVSAVEEPTPSQAEQLQTQIDTMLEDLRQQACIAEGNAEEANRSAAAAAASAGDAADSASAAAESEQSAQAGSAQAAAAAQRAEGSAAGAAVSADAAAAAVVRAAAQADRAQAEAERASVPAVKGVYNVVLTDRVTGERYALMVESGRLLLLGVSKRLEATEMQLIDSATGTAYALEAEGGILILKEV